MTTEYDAFAAIYEVQMGSYDADLDFYLGLAQDAEPPVLELATGTGRVSLRIARTGVPIVGVDSSVEMMAVAHEKLEKEPDLPLRLVEADMRDFDLPDTRGTFGLAIIPFRFKRVAHDSKHFPNIFFIRHFYFMPFSHCQSPFAPIRVHLINIPHQYVGV